MILTEFIYSFCVRCFLLLHVRIYTGNVRPISFNGKNAKSPDDAISRSWFCCFVLFSFFFFFFIRSLYTRWIGVWKKRIEHDKQTYVRTYMLVYLCSSSSSYKTLFYSPSSSLSWKMGAHNCFEAGTKTTTTTAAEQAQKSWSHAVRDEELLRNIVIFILGQIIVSAPAICAWYAYLSMHTLICHRLYYLTWRQNGVKHI